MTSTVNKNLNPSLLLNKRVNKLLESRPENDKETLDALKEQCGKNHTFNFVDITNKLQNESKTLSMQHEVVEQCGKNHTFNFVGYKAGKASHWIYY